MILYEYGGIIIWYLLPCQEQEEQKILDSCRKCFSHAALKDAFVLTYDRMRRYQGAWHVEKKLLFPANVLLESENEDVLKDELNQHRGSIGHGLTILKMSVDEEHFLKELCGQEKNLEMSRGVIRNGVTMVTEGPLKGAETRICKIDRHKRMAKIAVPKGRNIRFIPAGLEIMEKSV
jgi:hypothetical protein